MKITRIKSERNSRRTKVAAYVRVSTLNDNQDESYEAQAEYYDRKIRSNPDWDYAGIYCDRLSGTHTDNRENFKRLVQDTIDRKVDIILCKSVSRWARNTVEGLENIKEIGGAGAKVIFEQEGIDTSQAGSDFQLNLTAAVAQMESENISENMKLSYRNRAAQGKFIASKGKYFGFNTDDNRFRPDGNARYVEMIFNEYLNKEAIDMTIEKKLELIAEIVDMDPDELKPEMELTELENWDSVAALSFIAMMDEEFGKEIKGADIKTFVTIQDAINVMEG